MLAREEKYIYDWETKRGKGKWGYLFLTAIVWGSIFPIVFKAFKLALNNELSFSNLFNVLFTMSFLITWIKFFSGFFLFASLTWTLAKNKYTTLKQKQTAQRKFHVRQ